jgi:hypothetical protein
MERFGASAPRGPPCGGRRRPARRVTSWIRWRSMKSSAGSPGGLGARRGSPRSCRRGVLAIGLLPLCRTVGSGPIAQDHRRRVRARGAPREEGGAQNGRCPARTPPSREPARASALERRRRPGCRWASSSTSGRSGERQLLSRRGGICCSIRAASPRSRSSFPYGADGASRARWGQLAGNHFRHCPKQAKSTSRNLGRRVLWEGAQEHSFRSRV